MKAPCCVSWEKYAWVPAAALNKNIKWEAIDPVTAKATINYNHTIVSGFFQFNEMGDMIGFWADRYYKGSKGYSKEKWYVKIKAYKNFNGIRVSSECEVVWKLPEGDFNWMNVEIIAIDYNHPNYINKSDENK